MARRDEGVLGLRAFAVDRYDEDGNAKDNGTPVVGRFWRVMRCGYEWRDGYDDYKAARAEARRANRLEVEAWALLPHEREAALHDEAHAHHEIVRFLRRCFPKQYQVASCS